MLISRQNINNGKWYLNFKTGNKQIMKRLLVFLFIVLLLCGINILPLKELTLQNIFPSASVEVFTSKQTNNEGLTKIDNGMGEIIFCNVGELDYILNSFDSVSGFTLKFSKDTMSVNNLLNVLKVQSYSCKNFGIYGLSKVLNCVNNGKFKVRIEQTLCNFQIFEKENQIILGIPLILGSY